MSDTENTPNTQNLPAGMGSKASAPAPAPAPVPPTVPPLPVPPAEPSAPPVKLPGVEAPKPAPAANVSAQIADLAGDLVNDPYAKVGLTYVESVIADKNVDLRRAFGKAAEYGDMGLVDEAYLKEVLGDQAGPVVQQVKAIFEYSAQKQAQTMKTIYDSVGGEAALTQAVAAFNQHASAEQRKVIAHLLDSGDVDTMKFAAQQIMQFGQQAGLVMQKNQQPLGQAGAQKGLSQDEYIKAIMERNLSPEKYESLRKARLLGKQQGL